MAANGNPKASLSEVLEKVHAIFAEELQLDPSAFSDSDDLSTGLGLDSLAIYSAITEIEDAYQLVLHDSDVSGISTISGLAQLVFNRMNGTASAPSLPAEAPVREYHRLTDFAESPEYIGLKQRMAETFHDGFNPYFVPHDSLIRDTSVVNGKEVINLGSYNYLGMSGHPETMQAAIDAIKKYGTSASGSRTLAGEKTLYQQLEKSIAEWKHTEDAIVCTGGWATNLTLRSSFMHDGDFIVYDALSHNSIAEGVALSKAESKAFPHNDLQALESILQRVQDKYNKVLIVVEGVYSMDGDIAPIPEFVRLKKVYKCFLMVDEAHSGGVIGDHAGGCDDYFHLDPHDIDIKYGTLSKALGTCGGYIAADREIVEYLRYFMSGFVFSAGISPPLAAACMKAIEIIRRDNSAATKLHENIRYFVRRCKEEGMNTCLAGESAVVPILIGSDQDAARLSAELLDEGVFVPPAMYPAVPIGESRLRFTISATHSIEQLEKAVSSLAKLMHEEGFLK